MFCLISRKQLSVKILPHLYIFGLKHGFGLAIGQAPSGMKGEEKEKWHGWYILSPLSAPMVNIGYWLWHLCLWGLSEAHSPAAGSKQPPPKHLGQRVHLLWTGTQWPSLLKPLFCDRRMISDRTYLFGGTLLSHFGLGHSAEVPAIITGATSSFAKLRQQSGSH